MAGNRFGLVVAAGALLVHVEQASADRGNGRLLRASQKALQRQSEASYSRSRVNAEGWVVATFPANGIREIILRSAYAETAEVQAVSRRRAVMRIAARPQCEAEIPPESLNLSFAAKRYDDVLIISSVNEVTYQHRDYDLQVIKLQIPAGIIVTRERRVLNGSGLADLDLVSKRKKSEWNDYPGWWFGVQRRVY